MLTRFSNFGEMVSQLQTARNQLQFVEDSAQGMIGAINDSMRDLIAEPLGFYDGVATWKDDFTGQAGDIAEAIQALSTGVSFRDTWQTALDDARTVTANTVRDSYADRPADVAQAAVAAWQDREGPGRRAPGPQPHTSRCRRGGPGNRRRGHGGTSRFRRSDRRD